MLELNCLLVEVDAVQVEVDAMLAEAGVLMAIGTKDPSSKRTLSTSMWNQSMTLSMSKLNSPAR
jgi:hypothetical protein